MKLIKIIFFGVLFYGGLLYLHFTLLHMRDKPKVDWPEEIQAARPGDKFVILKIENNKIFLGYAKN